MRKTLAFCLLMAKKSCIMVDYIMDTILDYLFIRTRFILLLPRMTWLPLKSLKIIKQDEVGYLPLLVFILLGHHIGHIYSIRPY